MIASSSFPVDSLRKPSFASRYGVSATIMDYARQNYVAQPGDGLQPKENTMSSETARMEWTAERVRRELPRISCLMDGRKVIGSIAGRSLAWATVHLEGMESGSGFVFSWSTLAHCLNTGRLARIN